jgi:DNA-directed RNA polymerase subunit M/transcription elongation factor TFIIS
MNFCKKCGNRLNINTQSQLVCDICGITEPLKEGILIERSYVETDEHKDIIALIDKTYPMENIECPNCHKSPVVFRRTKELKKVYVCINCENKWISQ